MPVRLQDLGPAAQRQAIEKLQKLGASMGLEDFLSE